MTHRLVILIYGQSNAFAADALIDPAGYTYPFDAGTYDLVVKGWQTDADRAGLFCMSTPGITSVEWGAIRGHNTISHPNGVYATTSPNNGLPYDGGGPEVGFNRALYAAGYRNIAIALYADNFSALEDSHSAWYPGKSRYNAMIAYFDARLAELDAISTGDTHEVVAILCNQGIDNAILSQSGSAYKSDMRATRDAVRTRYGENIPFIIAQEPSSPYANSSVMAAIRVAEGEIGTDTNCASIEYDDLPKAPPNVDLKHHVTFQGHLTGGARFASVWQGLTTLQPVDFTAPVVTAFVIPATATSLIVSITSFTATDAVGVTGYLVSETSSAPAANDSGWSGSAPASYTFGSAGSKILHAWAKDAAGNVSGSLSDSVTITLPTTSSYTILNLDGTSGGVILNLGGSATSILAVP